MTCTTLPAPATTGTTGSTTGDVLDALARDLDTTQPPATTEMPETTASGSVRVAPGGFTRVPDWVWLAPISPTAKTLYGILAAHLNPSDPDRQVWPSRETLAALLGLTQARSVDPYLDELIAIGAISKTTTYTGQNMRSRNVYTIAWDPPETLPTPISLGEHYRHRRQQRQHARQQQRHEHRASERGAAARSRHRENPGQTRTRDRAAGTRPTPTRPNVSPGQPVVRSSAPRSAPQRTPVVRHSAPELDQSLNKTKRGAARASRAYASPPLAKPDSGPRACGAPHPDTRTERTRPDTPARTETRDETRPAGKEPETVPESAQETPGAPAGAETRDAVTEAVRAVLSAPGSATVLRPEPGRPETWKCDRHLANPDPEDRPCRGCKTVREHCERRDTELRLDAAAARARAARAARAAVKACTWCDEAGDVLNPATGHCYEPVIRCDHQVTTPERAAEINARPAPALVVAPAETRAAAIAAFRNRHRPDQTTPTAA